MNIFIDMVVGGTFNFNIIYLFREILFNKVNDMSFIGIPNQIKKFLLLLATKIKDRFIIIQL